MAINPTTAAVWSFKPNWAQGFRVKHEYKTEIITSRSGKEQRRALRTTPRREIEFESRVICSERREFQGLMIKRQNSPFVIPDWSRHATLAADTALGSAVLTLVTAPAWLVVGRAVFLYDRSSRPVVAHVVSVIGTSVTLSTSVTKTWAARAIVVPAPVGFFDRNFGASLPTNDIAIAAAKFSVWPTSEPKSVPAAASVTFNSREVFSLPVNWKEGRDDTFIWGAEMLDYARGAMGYAQPVAFPTQTRRCDLLAGSDVEAQAILDFFDRMKGQRGEFYLPSGTHDLPPAANLTSAGTTLRVAGTDTYQNYGGSTVYRALCVVRVDGTRIYRKVSTVTLSGGDSLITITGGTWGTLMTPTDILRIEWMPVFRLASDVLTLDWVTDTAARTSLTMQMIEDLTPEVL